MKYDFDSTIDQTGSGSIKYDGRGKAFGNANVIPMWIADMDFEAAPFISAAIEKRARLHTYGYGLHGDDYWNAYRNWLERRNGWKTEREWMDFTSGVVAGMSYAIRAFAGEGEGVVIMPPVYPPFAMQIKANGRRVVNSPLIPGPERYEIDFDGLAKALADAEALLLCNPHNPAGRVFSHEELMRIGELCCEHDVAIISDEIHSDIIFKPHRHLHIAALDERFAARSVTFVAPSKTFSVAGLSASVAITPDEEMRARLREELSHYHIEQGNIFETEAIKAAFGQGDGWVDQVCEYLDGNAAFAVGYFAENLPELRAYRPEGTYLLWVDFRGFGMPHEELKRFLIHSAEVGLSDGMAFGSEGEGFMRMNLATSRATVAEALRRIRTAYRETMAKHVKI